MIYDIFINITIVVAFLLVFGQISKYSLFDTKQARRSQAMVGLFFGILGIILMLFTIRMADRVIVDLRDISIICSGIMGGPLAAIFSAVIIALFRVIIFGINITSVTALLCTLVIGAEIAYISNVKQARLNKYILMFLYSMLINNINIIYLVRNEAELIETLDYFWLVNLFGAVLVYFTCEYIISANSSFRLMSYYKIMADNLLDMISTLKSNGEIIFTSPSAFQLLGYTPEELVGTSQYKYIHPEDIGKLKQAYSSLNDKKDNTTQIFRMRRMDAKYIWVEASVRAIRYDDGSIKEMLCVTRNISKRKEIEQELLASSARFKAIFDNAGTGIVLRDINENLIDVNSAYLDMIGYSREEVDQLPKIVYSDDYKKIRESFNNLVSGKCSSNRVEVRYQGKNQQIIYTEIISTLIPGTENTPASIIRVVNNITERKKAEEELRKAKCAADKLAATDFLTGMLNRRVFAERFNAEFQRALREKSSISLIMADIDYFKAINDTYGHQVGDHVLQKFAKCLVNACRPYDFIGRHGGEEFIICLPNTGRVQGKKVAERIRRAVQELNINLLYLKEPIKVTASFGVVSVIPDEEGSIDELIIQADRAMYRAKKEGRNRVCTACEDRHGT